MQINITTFAGRTQHYLHRTLETLFASDWNDHRRTVNLIVGSEDQSHLQAYASHPAVRIVPWDMETDSNLRRNCTLNATRALRHGDDVPTLVCEDDIIFQRHWFSALTAAIAEMGDEEYIMSLYLFPPQSDLEKARLVKGKLLVKQYPRFFLVGAQALFYPTLALRQKVADYLLANITGGCSDELIGRYARSYAALYSTKQVLVDHVGDISCFKEELDAWHAKYLQSLEQS
jgi:hypothetical protein